MCDFVSHVDDTVEWLIAAPDLQLWRLMRCMVHSCHPATWGDMTKPINRLNLLVHPDKTSNEQLSRWFEPLRELTHIVKNLDEVDMAPYMKLGCCMEHGFWNVSNWHHELAFQICKRLEDFPCFALRQEWRMKVNDERTFYDFATKIFIFKSKPDAVLESKTPLEALRNNSVFIIQQFLHTANFAVHKSKTQINKLITDCLLQIEYHYSTSKPNVEDQCKFLHIVADRIADIVDMNPSFVRTQIYDQVNSKLTYYMDHYLQHYVSPHEPLRSKRQRSPSQRKMERFFTKK